jgi:hypothetical protein
MGIRLKSMMEIEPPNYKKSFVVLLMAVLLISSLFVGMFAGQAMGQSETDSNVSEPLSIVRIIGSVIVTIICIILIISHVTKVISRKTAKINSTKEIELLPPIVKRVFLTILTWLFYGVYSYAEYAEKFNVMSRRVLKKDGNVNFHAKECSILLAFSYFIIIFVFANVFLLNPSVYTALFNLDGMALVTAIGEGFTGINLLFNGAWVAIIGIIEIFCLASALLFIGILDKPMRRTSRALLKYYMENYEEHSNFCVYMLNKYENHNPFASTMGLNYEAFNKLIEWHNKERKFDGYQRHL